MEKLEVPHCHGARNISLEIAEGSRMETDKVAEVPLQLRLSRFCFPFFASSAGCLVVAQMFDLELFFGAKEFGCRDPK